MMLEHPLLRSALFHVHPLNPDVPILSENRGTERGSSARASRESPYSGDSSRRFEHGGVGLGPPPCGRQRERDDVWGLGVLLRRKSDILCGSNL